MDKQMIVEYMKSFAKATKKNDNHVDESGIEEKNTEKEKIK